MLKTMNILIIIITINIIIIKNAESSKSAIFSSDGDFKLGLVIEDCEIHKKENPPYLRTIINSAIWTINRLNSLEFTKPFRIGLEIVNICRDRTQTYDVMFKMFQEHFLSQNYLGVVTPQPNLPPMVNKMADALSIPIQETVKFLEPLQVINKVLMELELFENILVFAANPIVLKEFYQASRKEWICINDFLIYHENSSFDSDGVFNGTILVLGNEKEISYFLKENKDNYPNATLILVPLDGKATNNIPDNSLLVQPSYIAHSNKTLDQPKPPSSPLLFEVASTFLSFTFDLPTIIKQYCNNRTQLTSCLRNSKFREWPNFSKTFTPDEILKILKIEPFSDEFVYDIFKVENLTLIGNINISDTNETNHRNLTNGFDDLQSTSTFQRHVKLFSYNIFSGKLIDHYELFKNFTGNSDTCLHKLDKCIMDCANFKSVSLLRSLFFPITANGIVLKPEPWVLAFLSVALLGILFCLAILTFLIIKSCKHTILEGNPVLTIILLLSVLLLFISVIPFCLQSVYNNDFIYLSRFLGLSLPYTLTFSILISRSIMLATITKESGYMNHISGYVQCCLQLFIFAVQCALVIQISRKCDDVFNSALLIFIFGYNSILLLILICIAPLIIKSSRNYTEGKYFTISILLIAIIWCFWLPGYTYLDHHWKEPMICLGLIGTAGALLGGVFIPRTYLMTISATRDSFASVLPSLATVSSTLDIYRANTQPIYDCVNIAAINAARAAAASCHHPLPTHSHNQQHSSIGQDYFGPTRIPDDEFEEVNLEVDGCNLPSPDKITRF